MQGKKRFSKLGRSCQRFPIRKNLLLGFAPSLAAEQSIWFANKSQPFHSKRSKRLNSSLLNIHLRSLVKKKKCWFGKRSMACLPSTGKRSCCFIAASNRCVKWQTRWMKRKRRFGNGSNEAATCYAAKLQKRSSARSRELPPAPLLHWRFWARYPAAQKQLLRQQQLPVHHRQARRLSRPRHPPKWEP